VGATRVKAASHEKSCAEDRLDAALAREVELFAPVADLADAVV